MQFLAETTKQNRSKPKPRFFNYKLTILKQVVVVWSWPPL